MGDKYIVRDLGRDGSPKCRLRKTANGKRQTANGKRQTANGKRQMSGLGTGRISRMPPQENVRGSQANVRISNTKEDEAKGDLGLGTGRISRMPPQDKVRGSHPLWY